MGAATGCLATNEAYSKGTSACHVQGLEGNMLDNLSEQTTAEKSAQKTAQETQQLRKQGQPGVHIFLAALRRGIGHLHLGLLNCWGDMACVNSTARGLHIVQRCRIPSAAQP